MSVRSDSSHCYAFKDGKVDEEALRNLIEFQIANGTDGIVPCGTTGESSTLSHERRARQGYRNNN